MMDKCELCNGTGWYGDNGPGIKGNREYVQCECGCEPKYPDPLKQAFTAGFEAAKKKAIEIVKEQYKSQIDGVDSCIFEMVGKDFATAIEKIKEE